MSKKSFQLIHIQRTAASGEAGGVRTLDAKSLKHYFQMNGRMRLQYSCDDRTKIHRDSKVKTQPKTRSGVIVIFENNVIRLLWKHKGDEKEVAKMIKRAIHVVRDTRYLVEERILRQKRSILAVTQSVAIEPESQESLLRIDRELEEIEVGCANERDLEMLRLLIEKGDVKEVAEIIGVAVAEVIKFRGRIAKQYAKSKRELGEPMSWLEKLAKSWLKYRPRHKQSNDWPTDRPKPGASKAKPVRRAVK